MSKSAAPLVLCDTDVFIRLFRKDPIMIDEFKHLGKERLALSVITKGEIYYGMKNQEVSRTKSLLNLFQVLPLDREISKAFVHYMYEYRNNNPHVPDCLIAATAISINARLFTLNRKHFTYYADLEIYNPMHKHQI